MNFAEWEALIDADPDEAGRQAALVLDKEPDNPLALFVIATVYSRAERFGVAANLFQRICQIHPDKQEAWNNLGMCFAGMGQNLKARRCFEQAWKLSESPMFASNLAMTYFSERDYKNARKWCEAALKLAPDSASAKTTLGMTKLSTGEWADGWQLYSASVGGKFRKNIQYQDEPMWDGTPGQTVVFYGEQGIGDEIMYASCVPDALKTCKSVILDCDKRLVNLLKRSFPEAHVYGTRTDKAVSWPLEHAIDARLPVGQLPQFFRPSPQSCPGNPYLVADPERRLQWRALFDSWGPRPKIGLCWSGGSKYNKPTDRNIGFEAMRPLLELEADFVSLQYKDTDGIEIKHYKRACETDDYDDTAAFVSELDLVIGVHTSAQHLAGALGVPSITLVPHKTIWVWALDPMPWYGKTTLFRQKEGEPWSQTIKRLLDDPCLRRFRREGNSGVSRLLSISDPARQRAGHVHTFGTATA
jgi:hypothetical protein